MLSHDHTAVMVWGEGTPAVSRHVRGMPDVHSASPVTPALIPWPGWGLTGVSGSKGTTCPLTCSLCWKHVTESAHMESGVGGGEAPPPGGGA